MEYRESPVTGVVLVVGPFLILGALLGLMVEGPPRQPSYVPAPPIVREAMEEGVPSAAIMPTAPTTRATGLEAPAPRGTR